MSKHPTCKNCYGMYKLHAIISWAKAMTAHTAGYQSTPVCGAEVQLHCIIAAWNPLLLVRGLAESQITGSCLAMRGTRHALQLAYTGG